MVVRVLPSRLLSASSRRCRRPPPRLPSAQSLRSGASLPGERPGEAPGSCSGSLNLPRPELKRRGRAGKPGTGGAGAARRGRPQARRGRLRRPLLSEGAAGAVPVRRHRLRAVCGACKRGARAVTAPVGRLLSGRLSPLLGGLPGLLSRPATASCTPAAAGCGGERRWCFPPKASGGGGLGGLAGASGASQRLATSISK